MGEQAKTTVKYVLKSSKPPTKISAYWGQKVQPERLAQGRAKMPIIYFSQAAFVNCAVLDCHLFLVGTRGIIGAVNFPKQPPGKDSQTTSQALMFSTHHGAPCSNVGRFSKCTPPNHSVLILSCISPQPAAAAMVHSRNVQVCTTEVYESVLANCKTAISFLQSSS